VAATLNARGEQTKIGFSSLVVFRREGGHIERSHKKKQQTKQPKGKEQKQKNALINADL
jgi:hypothetical protein